MTENCGTCKYGVMVHEKWRKGPNWREFVHCVHDHHSELVAITGKRCKCSFNPSKWEPHEPEAA